MEPTTPTTSLNTKIVFVIVAVLFIVGTVYTLSGLSPATESRVETIDNKNSADSGSVVVERAVVNGVASVPEGFPQDIPLENGGVFDGATSYYTGQNARQLSVSYQSPKSLSEKYAEYKAYMQKAGYQITEGSANAPVRSLSGVRADANFSVVLSSKDGGALIQLSYLIK